MFNHKLAQKFLTTLGAIGFGLLVAPTFVLSKEAQSDSQPMTRLTSEIAGKESKAEIEFTPPNRGGPEKTAEGGSRKDTCEVGLALLVPNGNLPGTTISEYPTFMWYLDPSGDPITALSFALFEMDREGSKEAAEPIPGDLIYFRSLEVPSQAQIMSLKIQAEDFLVEDDLPRLKEGKFYQWRINAYDLKDVEDYKDAFGSSSFCADRHAWIQRQVITPTQQQQFSSGTSVQEHWNFYSQNEIWYDALATLDELRRENSGDPTLDDQWRQTLESIEFESLADQPPAEIIQIVRESEETTNP